MVQQNDFKKEWPKIKKKLMSMSQEALVLAKKGEEQLVNFSKKGKLHIDSTALSLKREAVFAAIGKEFVKMPETSKKTDKMKKLLDELAGINKEIRGISRKLKSGKK